MLNLYCTKQATGGTPLIKQVVNHEHERYKFHSCPALWEGEIDDYVSSEHSDRGGNQRGWHQQYLLRQEQVSKKGLPSRITNSTKHMICRQKSHPLSQAHNLVQRYSLRRQCKQHQKHNSWRGEGPVEGKRKSARIQDNRIPV